MTDLLKLFDRLMAELQGVAGAKATRGKPLKLITCLMTEMQVHNEYGVIPAADFADAGVFRLAKRKSTAVVKGTNHNESEGAALSEVIDDALATKKSEFPRSLSEIIRSSKVHTFN